MKKTILTVLSLAGMASATELQELFYTTDYTEQIDLSQANLGDTNSLTFVITLDPAKLAALSTDDDAPIKHNIFQFETGKAGGLGALYWSDTPQFSIRQGNGGTVQGATTELPTTFSWNDVAGVALTLTTQEAGTRDKCQLHAYIEGTDGTVLLSTSYTDEKTISSSLNPSVFGMLSMTDLVTSAAGYKGTASAEEALAMAKEAVSGGTIPEPTTATLSLLALAGLAARRRRR